MGRKLGDPDDPLLVSVRSGAKFSMPGMMETVLDVGLNDDLRPRAGPPAGDERFAWDSYRRLVQMFGSTVLGIDGDRLRGRARRGSSARAGAATTSELDADDLRRARRRLQGDRARARRPRASRRTRASSCAWRSAPSSTRGTPTRAVSTAAASTSPTTSARPSTSRRWSSATAAPTPAPASPSPATRPPAPRACTATTCRTRQGEDVVAGIRNTVPLSRPRARSTQGRLRRAARHHGTPREPLPRHVRHRVHHRAEAGCGCCRPGWASAPPRPRSASPRHWSTRASSPRRRP